MTAYTLDAKTSRLLTQVHASVLTEWGRSAFAKLGDRIQRALLAEAVLKIAALQDDDEVADAVVRRIVVEGWNWAMEQAGY